MSAPMSESPEGASTPLLAVDTGGTFTDLVLLEDGEIRTLKVPSTPDDPSQAVLDGIREILGESGDFALLHGSTVATNALLERRGARVVLVTNEGFEDVIEIGRQDRPQLYALVGHRLPPLVDRDDRNTTVADHQPVHVDLVVAVLRGPVAASGGQHEAEREQ